MKTTMMLMFTAALTGLQATGTDVQAQDRKFKETITVQGRVREGMGDHTLTFSGPVALPGVSLAAGTYVFRQPLGNVIQVTSMAGMPYTMFITIPTFRQEALDEYSVVLGPSATPDSPRRIVALFVPGQRTGQEFVYPGR
jgi:hypothetical protein